MPRALALALLAAGLTAGPASADLITMKTTFTGHTVTNTTTGVTQATDITFTVVGDTASFPTAGPFGPTGYPPVSSAVSDTAFGLSGATDLDFIGFGYGPFGFSNSFLLWSGVDGAGAGGSDIAGLDAWDKVSDFAATTTTSALFGTGAMRFTVGGDIYRVEFVPGTSITFSADVTPAAVPEPGVMAMGLLATGSAAGLVRRFRRRVAAA